VFLLMIGLYLGGVVSGISMQWVLGQPWLSSSINLLTIMGMVVLTILYLRGLLDYQVIMYFACICGVLIFQKNSLWWNLLELPNQVAMVLVGLLGGLLFSSLMIFLLNPWVGFGFLGMSVAIFAATMATLNHRYPLVFMGLLLPATMAYGVVLLMFRRAVDQLIAALENQSEVKPTLDLGQLKITEPEFRSIQYLIQGLCTREMAVKEGVSASAINNRLSAVYRKMGVIDRIQLLHFLGRHELKFDPPAQ
jgi:DNA-binding CsgD family transcriptional regulator